MKHAALSDVVIRQAKAKDKRYFLTDGQGLVLEVLTTGSKFWRFRYTEGGKTKLTTLGKYPAVPLSEARQKAEELRISLARGVSPDKVFNPPHVPTFQEVAEEWLSKQTGRWAPRHMETVVYRLRQYLYPTIGNRPLKEITAPELLGVLRPIEGHGLIDTAQRCKQIFGQIACYGVATGACEADVSVFLKGALTAVKVKSFAALTKTEDIKRLLLAMREYQGSAVVRAALWLSIYTLARPGEIRHAEWAEIDLEGSVWNIPAEKMKRRKPHAVPLCVQAVELLKELRPLTGRWRWVFPSARNDGRPMSENAVRGIYNRGDYWDERVKMMQEWADWLDSLSEGQ